MEAKYIVSDKEVRLINANALKESLAKLTVEGGNKDFQDGVIQTLEKVFPYLIDSEPTVEAITREEFIRKAKELITAFVGCGEKTEENRILFALVFGNLELRLFGSRDGDNE